MNASLRKKATFDDIYEYVTWREIELKGDVAELKRNSLEDGQEGDDTTNEGDTGLVLSSGTDVGADSRGGWRWLVGGDSGRRSGSGRSRCWWCRCAGRRRGRRDNSPGRTSGTLAC